MIVILFYMHIKGAKINDNFFLFNLFSIMENSLTVGLDDDYNVKPNIVNLVSNSSNIKIS